MTHDPQDAYWQLQNHIDDATEGIDKAVSAFHSIRKQRLMDTSDIVELRAKFDPDCDRELPNMMQIELMLSLCKTMMPTLWKWQEGLVKLDEEAQAAYAAEQAEGGAQ